MRGRNRSIRKAMTIAGVRMSTMALALLWPGSAAAAGIGNLKHGADQQAEQSDSRQARDSKGGAPRFQIPGIDGETHFEVLVLAVSVFVISSQR